MDAFHLAVALTPLAAYLVALGVIHLRTRPSVTSGGRDVVALGLGISGMVVAGPMELFLPQSAARQFGPYVWLLLFALYLLSVILLALLARPRLVIYNVDAKECEEALREVFGRLDRRATWAGKSVASPRLAIHCVWEAVGALRQAQVVSVGGQQNAFGWAVLLAALRARLDRGASAVATQAIPYLLLGLTMMVIIITRLSLDGAAVASALEGFLRRDI